MITLNKLVSCAVIALTLAVGVNANEVLKEGYQAGRWTQDYDAAMAAAKKGGMPVLLNFTGSDWCGWCKKMDADVFSKPEWAAYAETNVALAYLDFPQDKTKVPEKFVARNAELSGKFGIEGYPTYILLDSATETELGRLSAQDNTPAKFIAKLNELKLFSTANLKKLSAADPAFKTAAAGYAAAKGEIASLTEQLKAAEKKQDDLRSELDELFANAKAKELGDRGPVFLAARKELKTAEQEMEDWMATGPERNEENMNTFQEFQKRIAEATEKLSEF